MSCKLAYWLGLISLSASLIGCSFLQTTDQSEAIEYLPLAPPIAPARRIVQQITATWPNGVQQNVVCVLELDNQHIGIAGLSADGISLFNLNYDGKTVKIVESPLLPATFSPELVIKDLQLVFWPLTELKKILPRQWQLDVGANYRHLFFNRQRFADIQYLQPDAAWPKAAKLINHRYHYELEIKTISYESLLE